VGTALAVFLAEFKTAQRRVGIDNGVRRRLQAQPALTPFFLVHRKTFMETVGETTYE
jgi:hypothetical protein